MEESEEEDEEENKENGETDAKKTAEGTTQDYPMARSVNENSSNVMTFSKLPCKVL